MKTVNQLSKNTPDTLVMLLSHLQTSEKVLCACQVPKVGQKYTNCVRKDSKLRIITCFYTRSFFFNRAVRVFLRASGLSQCVSSLEEMQAALTWSLMVLAMQPM